MFAFCILLYFLPILFGGTLLGENGVSDKGKSVCLSAVEQFYTKTTNQRDTCTMRSATVITKDREERDLNRLSEVRYNESLCSQKQLNLSPSERTVSLKIMTYNVLSQTLLEEHRYLYRNANPVTLKWNYRYPRLLAEIVEHNPDILCLQEVQENHIETFFDKLTDFGYVSVYKKRTGDKIDGCSIYYRANLFSLVSESKLEYYKQGIKELNRDNIGLIVRLFWWAGNRHVTVANTHLLYNPRRTDVRLAQISLLLSELNLLTDNGRNKDVVLLTGDLNSDPSSRVVELITAGYLTNHSILPHYNLYKVERPNSPRKNEEDDLNEVKEYSTHPSSQNFHNFKFKSVHPHWIKNDNEATTFQSEWVTADYIFYSSNENKLCLSSRLRLPTAEECRKYIKKLPNYSSPSDHLPLVATFLMSVD